MAESMMSYDKRLNIILKRRALNLRITSKILMLVPFLECLVLTGSMARGDARESSDIDLMFIVKPGRIYTTRFIISAILYITGLKRGSKDVTAHGKFCPNYYITSDYLLAPIGRGEKMDRYCAENYSKSVFLGGEERIFKRFFEANGRNWRRHINYSLPEVASRHAMQAGNYTNYSNCSNQILSQRLITCRATNLQKSDPLYILHSTFPIKNSRLSGAIRSISERILSGRFGDWIEKILKRIQLKKINSDPRTKKYPDLIVANDREMRFHPPKPHRSDTRDKDG
ncbi:hypothetical protein A2215_00625 [Candidatus Berkelbacteria bacterium RIFOXYA2_FULL_43_10]|uniref:Polymerase nucleotidyl transferase domain-containing protein n=1 Tax=Candidatus Berkelbacteria bacterium RIFOXYA2_FULL_43_10 TaxID=1797472 RepID=A0A1F5E6N7_9BACT|nr:MAG: hypothetical protein A2215_00625 [Candidatus Berkelbacteria bacterium RIFOXYA2_FULL_43_10]